MNKNLKKVLCKEIFTLIICGIFTTSATDVYAQSCNMQKTPFKKNIYAQGCSRNWDGVSNVSQFIDTDGELCFAYDDGKYINLVKNSNDTATQKVIRLKKKTAIYGAVTCDTDGYYYVVTGNENKTQDASKNTIFISKYDASGTLLASVGDTGNSSLAGYYSKEFCTQIPFKSGNCDVAVNGDMIAVNYARQMYNGHQSNSLFVINRKNMSKVNAGNYYNSHSFAQRIVPYGTNFALASEGDCYDRAFTVSVADITRKQCSSQNIFDFWIEKGALDRYDMNEVNNNFAHLGGIAVGSGNRVALVGTSAKSLNSNAKKEMEQLFIQIYNPYADLKKASGYVTSGIRTGMAGSNGDKNVTNYGVKWLTNYEKPYEIRNPQVAATPAGNYIILFEQYYANTYQGVYVIVLDGNGTVLKDSTQLSDTAYLNPGEMPCYRNGSICWVGNNCADSENSIYIYSYPVE